MTNTIALAQLTGAFCYCGLCMSGRVENVILRDFQSIGRGIQIAIHYHGGAVRRVEPPATLRDAYALARRIARTSGRALYIKQVGRPGGHL